MEFPTVLNVNHPSFGCARAVFLFQVGDHMSMVEAENIWAVACIERLFLGNPKMGECEMLAVFRNCFDTGIRSKNVQIMDYVDFIIDVIPHAKFLESAVMAYTYRMSLDSEQRDRALAKLQSITEPVVNPSPVNDHKFARVEAGLITLGFKKADVKAYLNRLDLSSFQASESDIVRQAIVQMTA